MLGDDRQAAALMKLRRGDWGSACTGSAGIPGVVGGVAVVIGDVRLPHAGQVVVASVERDAQMYYAQIR